MEHPAGEADDGSLRVDFTRRLKLEFHGSRITSDAGLFAYRELDDALELTDLAGSALSECRRGRNTRHLLTGLLRQSVFGRLAGYEVVNDADRLAHDPAMRAVLDRGGSDRRAASTSQMGRFETGWLACDINRTALADLSGAWIDRARARRPQTTIVRTAASAGPAAPRRGLPIMAATASASRRASSRLPCVSRCRTPGLVDIVLL